MASERRFLSSSEEATEALGERIGRVLVDGDIVALDGDLGAGKTCFVRGLARGLGVLDAISSPTYALMQSYAGRVALHHLDAWMEGRERAFLKDGGLEFLRGSGVTVVEWAARVADVLPKPHVSVRLEHRSRDTRAITLGVAGAEDAAAPIARRLQALEIPHDLLEF
jgi:tRNA threonylcarbamoyladenosine biosynthesis protein TsaE